MPHQLFAIIMCFDAFEFVLSSFRHSIRPDNLIKPGCLFLQWDFELQLNRCPGVPTVNEKNQAVRTLEAADRFTVLRGCSGFVWPNSNLQQMQ
jgi:hypothetical protein